MDFSLWTYVFPKGGETGFHRFPLGEKARG